MATLNTCSMCGHQQPATSAYCSQCGSLMPGLGTGLLPPNFILQQGRYVIVDKLGQGGMGAVYKVVDQRLGGKVLALKEMSDAAITDPQEKAQAIAAFRQEAQLLALLNHPNIPRVTDSFTENRKHYMVMEFVPGETLEDRLARQRMPCSEQEVRQWALQLCEVLSCLHGQSPPIIFRDLKPGNIMLTPQGQIKLIDFGIARLFKAGKKGDTQVIGTPGYSPPEQYGRGQTDARSDIYSLGVVLHHLLTLYDPATTPFKLPLVRQLNPAVSPQLEQIITKATQSDIQRRYQNVTEMEQAFRQSTLPSPPTPPVPTPLPQPKPQPRRGVPVWIMMVGILLALGLGIAMASTIIRGTQPAPTAPIVTMPSATHTPVGPTPVRTLPTPTEAATAIPIAPTGAPTKPPTPSYTPTRMPAPEGPTDTPTPDWAAYDSAVRAVVRKYGDVKVSATTYLDPSRLDEVLTDLELERRKRSVCWLRNEGLYYEYSDRDFEITGVDFHDDRHATALAQISENRVLRKESGGISWDYGREEYRAVYELKRIGNDWYIYCLQALEDGAVIECKVELKGEDPCK